MSELVFFLSLIIAIYTITSLSYLFGFRGKFLFFSIFPLAVFYLGTITFLLSINNKLTATNFLLLQLIIVIIELTYLIKYKIFFKTLPNISIINNLYFRFNPTWISNFFGLFIITLLIITTMIIRWNTMIFGPDDLNYRASAPLYWIQNQSVLRFNTLDERKNIFIMGTGLIYLWPLLFKTSNQMAVTFFGLSYPLCIIASYLLSGVFPYKRYRIVSSLLLASAPLVINNTINGLSQELWLGLGIVSFIFFLIQDINSNNRVYAIMVGLSFAIIPFLKVTSWGYLLLFLMYLITRTNLKKRILYISASILVCFLSTGYLFMIYQNNQLYGNPLGSVDFRTAHFADISLIQLKTHLLRFPFIFFEFPLLSHNAAQIVENIIRQATDIIGATKPLTGEAVDSWIEIYKYRLHIPNIFFGLGGVVWLIIIIINLFCLLKARRVFNARQYIYNYIFGLITIILLIQVMLIRWAEGSMLPYRHLISAFVASSAFFHLFIQKQNRIIYRVCTFLLFFYIGVVSLKQVVLNINMINSPTKLSNQSKILDYTDHVLSAYNNFLLNLNSPVSFLIVDHQNLLDFPLFWYKGNNSNKIYLAVNHNYDKDVFVKNIVSTFNNQYFDYLVLYGNEDLSLMIQNNKNFNYNKTELVNVEQFEKIDIFSKQ